MRKKLKDCTVVELKRYCIKRKLMPSGCTRCKLFHKENKWIDKNTGIMQIISCYCNMSATPDLYLTDIENDIILDIPKEDANV